MLLKTFNTQLNFPISINNLIQKKPYARFAIMDKQATYVINCCVVKSVWIGEHTNYG